MNEFYCTLCEVIAILSVTYIIGFFIGFYVAARRIKKNNSNVVIDIETPGVISVSENDKISTFESNNIEYVYDYDYLGFEIKKPVFTDEDKDKK